MRRQYLVEGEVQGVGFRYFTRRKARQLGLQGWVRNLRDGRVEVLAEGDPDRLRQLEDELRRGPEAASVTNLRETETSSQEELPVAFEIR